MTTLLNTLVFLLLASIVATQEGLNNDRDYTSYQPLELTGSKLELLDYFTSPAPVDSAVTFLTMGLETIGVVHDSGVVNIFGEGKQYEQTYLNLYSQSFDLTTSTVPLLLLNRAYPGYYTIVTSYQNDNMTCLRRDEGEVNTHPKTIVCTTDFYYGKTFSNVDWLNATFDWLDGGDQKSCLFWGTTSVLKSARGPLDISDRMHFNVRINAANPGEILHTDLSRTPRNVTLVQWAWNGNSFSQSWTVTLNSTSSSNSSYSLMRHRVAETDMILNGGQLIPVQEGKGLGWDYTFSNLTEPIRMMGSSITNGSQFGFWLLSNQFGVDYLGWWTFGLNASPQEMCFRSNPGNKIIDAIVGISASGEEELVFFLEYRSSSNGYFLLALDPGCQVFYETQTDCNSKVSIWGTKLSCTKEAQGYSTLIQVYQSSAAGFGLLSSGHFWVVILMIALLQMMI